jgi:uncharacterized protein (DUF58 family)
MIGVCIFLLLISFFISPLFFWAQLVLLIALLLTMADYFFLFVVTRKPAMQRNLSDRLSNGDINKVSIRIRNNMNVSYHATVIDELPVQLQVRDFSMKTKLSANKDIALNYTIRPTERGNYEFGNTILYMQSALGLISRRVTSSATKSVSVYPSFLQLRNYQLSSQGSVLNEKGSKSLRKLGHSMEFEQIKEYVTGDDFRSVNWKATARKGNLMVNNYTDEKSQQVYCIIDKGRLMKMPFNGLTLLDYAINSTLVLSHVCLQKQDKIGLVTFANKMGTLIPASRNPVQRDKIIELLYKQETGFLEPDFEMLYLQIRSKIKQRSLLILYTNMESLNGLKRQMPYLRSIARHHLLLVVFFENTELTSLVHAEALNLEDVYVKTIAEKFNFEKRMIVKELQKYGIASVLSTPEALTVNALNKYLELKNRQAI